MLVAIRAQAARNIDRVFAGDAPLARALLIADQRQIPTEMRDRYAAAGLVHMLSISGLHVAIIAAAMELLFVVARLPRRMALACAFLSTGIYVAVIGAPAPALRAASMLGVSMISRLRQRPTSPWAALALGALVPLINPRTVLDVGYQLSVLGMSALIAGGILGRRLFRHRSGWKPRLAGELATSVIACVVTAPLVAWTFGRVSLIAPIANLAAAPLIGLAQPMLFLTLLFAAVRPLESLAVFCAEAVHPLLLAFDRIATAAADMPGSSLIVATDFRAALLGAIVAGATIVACVARFPSRPVIVAAASASLMTLLPLLPIPHSGLVELHVLDVGQGDAILLRSDAGRWVLLDAGPAWKGGDAGRNTILPYLQRRGGELEAFVLSHPHTDHVGGAATVLARLKPRVYWDAAFAGGSLAYGASLAAAQNHDVEWRRVHPGDTAKVDGVTLRFLAPDSGWTVGLTDPNLASTVTLIQYGLVRFLLVGDAEWAEEQWLVDRYSRELGADVLKVGHHGSSTSSSDEFLGAVQPRVAIISVGAGNKYGHPSNDVLRALANSGADVLRTDESGTVIARTNGIDLEIEAGGSKWELSRASQTR